jgi:N-methylhydantoinase A
VQALIEDFHAAHETLFAVSDPHSGVETVGWNAEVHCRVGSGRPGRLAAVDEAGTLPRRRVRFAQTGWTDTPVHRFETLEEGRDIAGPAIVESGFTSVVLDPRTWARRDGHGSLIIDLHGTESQT